MIAFTIGALSQVPEKMSYQAVIRNASGELVKNNPVGMKISILQGSVTGTPVYVETQNSTSNENGLVTLEIGGGTPLSGAFEEIDWATGAYFIKTETDPIGGTNYTLIGTSQLLSVPYALHSKTVQKLINADAAIGEMIYFNGTQWVAVSVGLPGQYLQLSQSKIPNWTGPTFSTVTTASASLITANTANIGGTISYDGGAAVTSRGICYSTSSNPSVVDGIVINGTGTGVFFCTLPDLTSNTIYYARAFATNIVGTAYGNEISFVTLSSGASTTVTDVEGNIYNTVNIGTQVWMVENLKTSKYRNGDQITIVTDYTEWPITTGPIIPAACGSYDFTLDNLNIYGYLYNWFAVNDSRHLCPTGWHVPDDIEWQVLTNYLSPGTGGKLKEAGTTHWKAPNLEGTNETGFTGLPGGRIDHNVGWAGYIGESGYWWSSTSEGTYDAGCVFLSYNTVELGLYGSPKGQGNSVRCIKDNLPGK